MIIFLFSVLYLEVKNSLRLRCAKELRLRKEDSLTSVCLLILAHYHVCSDFSDRNSSQVEEETLVSFHKKFFFSRKEICSVQLKVKVILLIEVIFLLHGRRMGTTSPL